MTPRTPDEPSMNAPERPAVPRGTQAWNAWSRFFFTPADPRPLALIRIAVALLLLWSYGWLATDFHAIFRHDGWADSQSVRSALPPGAWSLWFTIPEALHPAAYGLGLVALVALFTGVGSRVAAVVAWVFVVSTMRRVPMMLFGFDNVIATWLLYLAASGASGQAYAMRLPSRDRLVTRPTISANLGLRLIQLHLCLIYASAGLAKLQGRPWWDGSAVGMLLGNSEFRTFDLGILASHPRVLELATHATIALELLYPILVWFRGWRPWLIAGAVAMHLGIALAMGLTEFSLAMIAGNLAFVSADWFPRHRGLARVAERRLAP